jgi:ribonuclease BN (tRNA processing enzyme)
MMSNLTLLGTGTCQIEFERRASSVLLELDDAYILFDCGHGTVQRLLEAGIHHNQVDHLVLSHFHPDHVSDLIPFLHAGAWSRQNPRSSDIHVYGPEGVQNLIEGFVRIFGIDAFQQSSYSLVVHQVTDGFFGIGFQHFEFLSLPPAGNHGLRFTYNGKTYALTGDSHFHAEEVEFLKGVDLAVIDSGHLEDGEIVELAVASQARMIVCSHLYREIDAPRLQAQAELRGYQGSMAVGRDLMSFVL